MRETTITEAEHPYTLPSGAASIVDREAMDGLLDKLHNGQPELGWAGDKRLCLAFNRQNQRWELWRLEHDSEYRLVAQSQPGMGFPHSIIRALVDHDTRRGYDVGQDIIDHNTRLQAEKDAASDEVLAEKMRRVYHAVGKDIGHLY